MDRIEIAAKMAGQWWADRLTDEHADKRDAFAAAVAIRVAQEIRGECHWDWFGEKKDGGGGRGMSRTEFDYDPHYLLIEVFAEVIGGRFFDWKTCMPYKRSLDVYADRLCPKDGYGNWVPDIPVPTST